MTPERKKIHPLIWVGAAFGVYLVSQGETIRKQAELETASKQAQSGQTVVNEQMKTADRLAQDGSVNALVNRVEAGAIPVNQVVANQTAVALDGTVVRPGLFVVDRTCSTAQVNGAGRMDYLLKIQRTELSRCLEVYQQSAKDYFGIDVPIPEN